MTMLKVGPNPEGTIVKQVDSFGKQIGSQFFSTSWNAIKQARKEGCPQWIYQIVVSESLDGAKRAAGLIRDTGIASSSRSSRDLQVIQVDKDGKFMTFFKVPFVLVPTLLKTPSPVPFPIAAEMWFSDHPFDTEKTDVLVLEKDCKAT